MSSDEAGTRAGSIGRADAPAETGPVDVAAETNRADDAVLRVEGLKKHFPVTEGIFRREVDQVRAVDGVSFAIPEGETFGLVGESGSGKTTVAKSVLRIEEPTAGTVEVAGESVTDMDKAELRSFRKNMQMVFQDPTSSLNPRKHVGEAIEEPMKVHDVGTAEERTERAKELLETVGLTEEYYYRYPNALSGGQKQRVAIARAVILNPALVVMDEPTSALDVSVQARIVDLFDRIQSEFNITSLFISHDLSLVKNVADRIGVMYLGKIVEMGETEAVFENPQHPYTRALLSAIPTISEADEARKPERIELEGEIPDPREKPTGCSFRTRCQHAFGACSNREPPFYRVEPGTDHVARCLLHDEEHAADAPAWTAR
ncbi:ABC transporter ATP-binding protein [Halovivax limisalsi]|uniref:ABC transporter ATP-binding protein n=1 Tax=Halovivax limisalsi TaxID=1453760 RepID=UPI001FFD5B38|nr:oligopeptide/dipeptide ABC transporter ATP-binding protein [Halovivax limisalsi]